MIFVGANGEHVYAGISIERLFSNSRRTSPECVCHYRRCQAEERGRFENGLQERRSTERFSTRYNDRSNLPRVEPSALPDPFHRFFYWHLLLSLRAGVNDAMGAVDWASRCYGQPDRGLKYLMCVQLRHRKSFMQMQTGAPGDHRLSAFREI